MNVIEGRNKMFVYTIDDVVAIIFFLLVVCVVIFLWVINAILSLIEKGLKKHSKGDDNDDSK